jgi:hypothetical protein
VLCLECDGGSDDGENRRKQRTETMFHKHAPMRWETPAPELYLRIKSR